MNIYKIACLISLSVSSLFGAVLVDEDFSGTLSNWTVDPSLIDSASIIGGELAVDSNNSKWGTVLLNTSLGSDFIATWDTKVTVGDYTLINLHAGAPGYNSWGAAMNGYAMWVDIDDTVTPKLEVQSFQSGAYRPGVGNGDVSYFPDIALNEWISWKVEKNGANIQVVVNGQIMHNFNDSLYENSDFYIGLGAAGNNANFDNLLVTSSAVPEPSTYALLALGLFGLGVYQRKRKK